MDVNEFAQLVLTQTKERLAAQYSQAQADWEDVEVIPGPKYTKVDLGTRREGSEHIGQGKYMVENETGIIYGIKGYGRVHKGHTYGTLDTANEWYWGGYVGERRDGGEFQARRRRAAEQLAAEFGNDVEEWLV